MQSRRLSLIEAWTNAVVGFLMSWVLMAVWLQFPLEPQDSFLVTVSFTFLTVTRSYILRRAFNAYAHRRS